MDRDKKILHFTIGPVQGFVGQARRTRDLWAGSYLLSYLAGHAMKVVKDGLGEIVFPRVDKDPLYLALTNVTEKPTSIDDPAASVGSLPNRFKAKVPQGFEPKKCVEAVQKKWQDIAQAVLEEARRLGINLSSAIWKSQIDNLWDCAWAIGDDDAVLDIRKNLRTHLPLPEKGEKCTVCGERQELSGKGMGTRHSRNEMKKWWDDEVRARLKSIQKATLFDLKEGERLCAVCLIKRAFPFSDIAKIAIGWEVPVNYPSTSYMAAVDWIIRVFKTCADAQHGAKVQRAVRGFIDNAVAADVWLSETATHIDDISKAGGNSGLSRTVTNGGVRKEWQFFADLDGDALFKSAIRNPREFEIAGDAPPSDPQWVERPRENLKREALEEALDDLQKALPEKSGQPREATPFYALLLMDGDNMGKLLSGYKTRQEDISRALAAFTRAVPDIVKQCNGKLIYAGGDDVFALLPLDDAIECARWCREVYIKAFDTIFGTSRPNDGTAPRKHETTISAAIEYAHMQTALGVIVRDAHKLLDELAKTQCGRDGLACRVWKRGGPVLTWAQPWEVMLDTKTIACGKGTHATILDEVRYAFQDASDEPSKFSSKFFYKVRDLFDLLAPGGILTIPEDTAKRILATEYVANRDVTWPGELTATQKRATAEERVARLLTLCRRQRRKIETGLETFEPVSLSADGALLVRFLSQKEV